MPAQQEGEKVADKTVINFYYIQQGSVIVEHRDRETNDILLKEEPVYGEIGSTVETSAKNFEGYVLVESPEETEVEIEEGEKVVTYYYAKVSAGVIEKHIDEITGDLLYSELHEGNEGDSYNIPSKEFTGYKLVEEKLPTNYEGEMTEELIEVIYYYRKPVEITVEYVDRETGDKIAEDEIIKGYKGEEYSTEEKEIEGYVFVEVEGKTEGEMSEDTTITYYYDKEVIPEPEPEPPIEETEEPIDNTVANTVIPQTGENNNRLINILVVILIAFITIITCKKYKEYKKMI